MFMPVQRQKHSSTIANIEPCWSFSQVMGFWPRSWRSWFIIAPSSSENIILKMMPATTTEHSTGMKATVLNRLPALLSLLSAI